MLEQHTSVSIVTQRDYKESDWKNGYLVYLEGNICGSMTCPPNVNGKEILPYSSVQESINFNVKYTIDLIGIISV